MIIRIFLLLSLLYSNAIFAKETDMMSYIDDLLKRSFAILKQPDGPTKIQQIKSTLKSNMDTNWMAKFVAGRSVNNTKPDVLSRYFTVYSEYVVQCYADALTKYNGHDVKITEVQKIDTQFSIVKTLIINTIKDTKISIDYLVETINNRYYVCDITAEGISMINTQKSEFANIIINGGLEVLTKALEYKLNND
jgi:phospholipid transport system substrate-binding protein